MKKAIAFALLIILLVSVFPPLLRGEEAEEKSVNIAIIPWKIRAPEEFSYIEEALYDMISSRMAVERQINMVMESSSKAVYEKFKGDELTEERIRDMGRELEADYVITGSLTLIASTLSLDARAVKVLGMEAPIHTVSQGKGMESLIPLLGRMALDFNEKILKREGLSASVTGFGSSPRYVGSFGMTSQQAAEQLTEEERSDFLIVTRESTTQKNLWQSQTFSTHLSGMAIGDTNGDGSNEIVLIDRKSLWIYRKTGDTLEFLKEFKGDRFDENLTVDVADINDNGQDEIYVTKWVNDRLSSQVLEFQDGEYKEIASGLSWFLRVLDVEENGKVLLGQRAGGKQFFYRDVKRLAWQDNQLTDAGSYDLPSGVNIYGFITVDVDGDGTVEAISFDVSDHIVVHSKKDNETWEERWRSKDYFGGSLNKILLESGDVQGADPEDLPEVAIQSRILQRDLDKDGQFEVILNKNITSTIGRYFNKSRTYKKGEMVNLIWEGNSLEENWKTKELEGYISDFQIDDIDSDGFQDLIIILITELGGMKKQPASHLISYRLNVR